MTTFTRISVALAAATAAAQTNPPQAKGVADFFSGLPKTTGVDLDGVSSLEKLKGTYHIPDTDPNFKSVLNALKAPKPTVLASQYPSMVVPMPDGQSTSWTPSTGGNWAKGLYGHAAPDSVGDVFYDASHPIEWGAALGHDIIDDAKNFRFWHLTRIALFLFFIYLVIGSFIRFKWYGERGMQMIPHIDVWTGMALNVQALALLISQKLGAKPEVQSRISQKGEYEDFGL